MSPTTIAPPTTTLLPLYSSPVLINNARRLPSHGAKVCRFIEENVRLGPGDYYGEPFKLTSYQRRWIWRLFEYYPDTGIYRYKRALFGTGKGNGKTPFEATLGVACLAGPTAPLSPLVLVAASTKDQADLVFGDMREGIRHDGCPLKPFLEPMQFSIQRKDGPGEAKRVAAVDGSNDGPRATVLLADEVHEWLGRLENVFTILDGAIGKRRNAFTVGISTAGHDQTSLLGKQYAYGKKVASGEIVDDAFLFEWYEAPDHLTDLDDPEVWDEAVRWANPALAEADFLTRDYIRSRFDGAQAIPRYQWERYHLNRWTAAESMWLPPGAWEACAEKREVEGSVTLAFAGTYSNDSAALVGVTEAGYVFVIDAWESDSDLGVDRAAVSAAVKNAIETYHPWRMVCNPIGWTAEVQSWEDAYGGAIVAFEWAHQMKRKAAACSRFYSAVIDKKLSHSGDPCLARHLGAVMVKETTEGAYISKGGRESMRKVELAVAAVMAYDQIGGTAEPLIAWE
jgi:phage terminase large subunit-like protein